MQHFCLVHENVCPNPMNPQNNVAAEEHGAGFALALTVKRESTNETESPCPPS